MLRRLALTPEEIALLPANYGQAVASGAFPKEFNPASPRSGLSCRPTCSICWDRGSALTGTLTLVKQLPSSISFTFSGRSRFLVFVRLPAGHKATLEYFRTLWNFPQPWVQSDPGAQADVNPNLPSFPAGTQVARCCGR